MTSSATKTDRDRDPVQPAIEPHERRIHVTEFARLAGARTDDDQPVVQRQQDPRRREQDRLIAAAAPRTTEPHRSTDAMTDPRPRVTNRIGNAQHTSVVRAVVSPTMLLTRSVRMSLPPGDWEREIRSVRNQMRSGGSERFGGRGKARARSSRVSAARSGHAVVKGRSTTASGCGKVAVVDASCDAPVALPS